MATADRGFTNFGWLKCHTLPIFIHTQGNEGLGNFGSFQNYLVLCGQYWTFLEGSTGSGGFEFLLGSEILV